MDLVDAIMTRRSIRKYTGKDISEDDLKAVLRAGFQAPSAMNREPREYIVVRDKDTIEKIVDFHQYTKMLPEAGCGIIVCGDKSKQEEIGFLVADCSASIQNMLLSAHGLELGAVWCGIYSVENLVSNMAETLELPDHIIPIGMVVLGEKSENKKQIDRYDKSKVHFDKW